MTPSRSPTGQTPRQTIGIAAVTAIDHLDWSEFLAAITPERIGQLTGYSPSSIRYRLNTEPAGPRTDAARAALGPGGAAAAAAGSPAREQSRGWSFDRRQLFLLAVDTYVDRTEALLLRARERYLQALTELERTGSFDALAAAIEEELSWYAAGASDDPTVAEAQRLFHLALAACDASPEIARRLRAADDRRRDLLRPVYETALRVTARELREGVQLDHLVDEIGVYLDGVAHRRRLRPALAVDHSLNTVLAIFAGLSQPLGGPAAPSPADELLRSVRSG